MDWWLIIQEATRACLENIWQIAIIVFPLMLCIEIFSDLGLLAKTTRFLTPLTKMLRISPEGNLPLLAGLFFGISYSGGLIIDVARRGRLSIREIFLINLFLIICHAVFEETMLFAAIGAEWIPILLTRIVLAVVITFIWSRYLPIPGEK